MHVHIIVSRISEILFRNQLALLKDELLCHWHSGYVVKMTFYVANMTFYVAENNCNVAGLTFSVA